MRVVENARALLRVGNASENRQHVANRVEVAADVPERRVGQVEGHGPVSRRVLTCEPPLRALRTKACDAGGGGAGISNIADPKQMIDSLG